MKPRNHVSLILSNYNYGEYIYETVACISRQSEVPDELIIVDDGSTDHSRELLQRIATEWSHVRLVLNDRNLGCAVSLNQAYAIASGRFVSSLGMDDPVHDSTYFARAVEQTRKHPNAGFYFGECRSGFFAPTATFFAPIAVNLAPQPRYFSPAEFTGIYESRANLSIPTVPSLWPREALIAIGGMMEKLSWLADWFAAHVLCFRSGACYLPGSYQTIRYNPRSLSHRGQMERQNYRALLVTLLETLEEPSFADVQEAFRIPAVMGRHGFKLLELCAREERFAKYLSPGLIRSACLYETGRFDLDLSRFGRSPPLQVRRELARMVLDSCSARLRQEASQLVAQGRFAQAVLTCRKAADAAPGDTAVEGQLVELTSLSSKWSRTEDRL